MDGNVEQILFHRSISMYWAILNLLGIVQQFKNLEASAQVIFAVVGIECSMLCHRHHEWNGGNLEIERPQHFLQTHARRSYGPLKPQVQI